MTGQKDLRGNWVYWITLAAVCGQLYLWILGATQYFESIHPLLAFVSLNELIVATFKQMGFVRFVQFFGFLLVNILTYSAIALLLLLANPRAKTIFLVSVGVTLAQQLLDMVLTFPDGTIRDWVTTIAGNIGLALYVWLLYLAFENLFGSKSPDFAEVGSHPAEANHK